MQQNTPLPERKQYAEITIAALTGEISALYLVDPAAPSTRSSISGLWPLERALQDLADGGSIIDLRPLANHPHLTAWVYGSPSPNGHIEGEEIARFTEEERETAEIMLPALGGDFQRLASLAIRRIGEPTDGSAGPLDYTSSAYRARYWQERGARIGRRVGGSIQWSDGIEQPLAHPATAVPPKEPPHEE